MKKLICFCILAIFSSLGSPKAADRLEKEKSSRSSVKEKIEMFEALKTSLSSNIPPLRKPEVSQDGDEASPRNQAKKVSIFFQRSKSARALPKSSLPPISSSERDRNSPRILQKLKGSFSNLQESKKDSPGKLRKSDKNTGDSSSSPSSSTSSSSTTTSSSSSQSPRFLERCKRSVRDWRSNNKGSNDGPPEGFKLSRVTINEQQTKGRVLDLSNQTALEQELSEKIKWYDKVANDINHHIAGKVIDVNDERYIYVLKPDFEELASMHVAADKYIKGDNSIRNLNAEEVTAHIQSMEHFLLGVGQEIFWITGHLESPELEGLKFNFEKKLEEAKRQKANGEESKTPKIYINHPRPRGKTGGGSAPTTPRPRRAFTGGPPTPSSLNQ